MMSTFPARFSADSSLFLNHSTPVEPGSPQWVYHEPAFLFDPIEKEPEPASSNSGSDTSNPVHSNPNSGSPDSNKSKTLSEEPGLELILDERKRRRMISNRESARRSRIRKQKHLENLRTNLTRLKVANRELKNRAQLAAHQNQFICRENECLRSEAVMLRKTLCDMRQVLLVRQFQNQQRLINTSAWPCNNVTSLMTQL